MYLPNCFLGVFPFHKKLGTLFFFAHLSLAMSSLVRFVPNFHHPSFFLASFDLATARTLSIVSRVICTETVTQSVDRQIINQRGRCQRSFAAFILFGSPSINIDLYALIALLSAVFVRSFFTLCLPNMILKSKQQRSNTSTLFTRINFSISNSVSFRFFASIFRFLARCECLHCWSANSINQKTNGPHLYPLVLHHLHRLSHHPTNLFPACTGSDHRSARLESESLALLLRHSMST